MNLLGFGIILTFGIPNIEAAIKITHLSACSTGTLTVPPDDALRNIDRILISEGSWKYRCCDGTDWTNAVHYDSLMSPRVMERALPDGRQITSGANGTLMVKSSVQESSRDHAQYRFEILLKNGYVINLIFKVNFTVECVWTWPNSLFNLTRLLFSIYPVDQVVEINLYDINRTTKFAHQSKKRGASIEIKDVRHPMPEFLKRLRITSRGALMLIITNEDNGTEIRAEANLQNSEGTSKKASGSNMETVNSRTIKIFVNAAQEPPSGVFPSKTSSYSSTSSYATGSTMQPKPRDTSAAYQQPLWLVTVGAVAGFLCL